MRFEEPASFPYDSQVEMLEGQDSHQPGYEKLSFHCLVNLLLYTFPRIYHVYHIFGVLAEGLGRHGHCTGQLVNWSNSQMV